MLCDTLDEVGHIKNNNITKLKGEVNNDQQHHLR